MMEFASGGHVREARKAAGTICSQAAARFDSRRGLFYKCGLPAFF